MSINQLILRSLKKNLKNYYLYVFALVFSSALYFAFVTLQYDPAMDQTKETVKGAASLRAASILLVAIVTIFLLYANRFFIKRRSKEFGLFQLIGMTKNSIFRLLSTENFLLYYGSLLVGILLGFSFSKLVMMILLKITGLDVAAKLYFSTQALVQTTIVFTLIFLFIMVLNFFFIKRRSILALFRVLSSSEEKVKPISAVHILLGILGIVLIVFGYYLSSKLFDGDFTSIKGLFLAMISILASVIIGTYLFYKGSVSFIFHLIRRKKDGYLTIQEVLSLSSIMFRMKSNALLLTIITTLSALAIALLSLSYISYYSADKTADNEVAADFALTIPQDAEQFENALTKEQIKFQERRIDVIQVQADLTKILDANINNMGFNPEKMALSVISERSVNGLKVSPNESFLTGYSDLLQKYLSIKDTGTIELMGKTKRISLHNLGLQKASVVSWYFTDGGTPTAVVDEAAFKQLKSDLDPSIQKESSLFIGITLKDKAELKRADALFTKMNFSSDPAHFSKFEISSQLKQQMGLIMFIVGFLGLTFLITSGCILYFKQMGESEEEKPSYTVLRKLGFTRGDLAAGIRRKQLFSFGIPLVIGLLHSYFAVQSGWFLFGTQLWTPMIIVMLLYTALYSIFGILSIQYYKKVIKEAL